MHAALIGVLVQHGQPEATARYFTIRREQLAHGNDPADARALPARYRPLLTTGECPEPVCSNRMAETLHIVAENLDVVQQELRHVAALAPRVGAGLRQLLRPQNEADLEEARHTCENGLLDRRVNKREPIVLTMEETMERMFGEPEPWTPTPMPAAPPVPAPAPARPAPAPKASKPKAKARKKAKARPKKKAKAKARSKGKKKAKARRRR